MIQISQAKQIKDASRVLENRAFADRIDEDSFNQLIKDFRLSYLDTQNILARFAKHRYPPTLKNEVLKELYDYLLAIQNREVMRDHDPVNNTSGVVSSVINEIWRSNRHVKTLYNAVGAYCELRKSDFNTIAVHIAEYRAMNKLIPFINRQGVPIKVTQKINPPLMNPPNRGMISFSSRYYEPLQFLKSKVDASNLFSLVYNEDKETYSLPYLYGNYTNTIEPVSSSNQILNAVTSYLANNLYNRDEIKLLLNDLMPLAATFGESAISSLRKRLEMAEEIQEEHKAYIAECAKTINSLQQARELIVADLTAYYRSVALGDTITPVPPYKPQNTVSNEAIYLPVLKILSDYGKDLETKPRVYTGQSEEGLRDHFLTALSGRYQHITATGETFNKGGKTDILLKEHSGRNVFIAECKWWSGITGFYLAIDQLFDNYIAWRDNRTAILLFVANKDLSNVISKVAGKTQNHPYFVESTGVKNQTDFSFIFRQKDDPQRHVYLEVMLFHFPSKS